MEYCPQSRLPVDHILTQLYDLGLTARDIEHFEDLSDPQVLAEVVDSGVYLTRNDKDHVMRYIQGWITVLEKALFQALLRAVTTSTKSKLKIKKPPDYSGVFNHLRWCSRRGFEPPTRGFSVPCSTN